MRDENEATVLLEALQKLAACSFLSDLHAEKQRPALAAAVTALDAELYSVQSWNYAASYIAKVTCAFSTAAEAQAWLSRHLSGR